MALAASGDFVVDANANSTGGGVGVATFALLAGQEFSVSVAANDLWSAGPLPRWSNADGLVGDLFYTAGTDSEVPVYAIGTQIGQAFSQHGQGGLSAAYGSLVGQIGNGSFFKIGTSYSGTATAAGILNLYYFDSINSDNTGSISAHVSAVPEPETYAMLLAGLGLLGGIYRRRKQK
ncbi:PEP-CTERM sorting domain-containing protein [Ferribacterium limneticum]|uniref:PEP-CTERM sorting domain-containing protein n=1 Tax=Ferribacterium limneticum TaxID=76259 RepID=UPI001CF85369|nr:PEP-CTERM sorting domain-containing protein [Ferribacterium limneticum]UCV24682.1 PEP-CTERM sorting domain-containing protein [Ferribacterium limneticum]